MLFALTRQRGPAWDLSRSMRQQDRWSEHAAFMDGLAEDGFVVLGGPLAEGERGFLFLVEAASAEEVHLRLAADPWVPMGLLTTTAVDRWELLLVAAGFRRAG